MKLATYIIALAAALSAQTLGAQNKVVNVHTDGTRGNLTVSRVEAGDSTVTTVAVDGKTIYNGRTIGNSTFRRIGSSSLTRSCIAAPLGIGQPEKKSGNGSCVFPGELYFGWVDGIGAGNMSEMFKSLEIGVDKLIGYETYLGRTSSLAFGLGINWRNWRNTLWDGYWTAEGGKLVRTDYPEDVRPKFTRIKMFSLMLPVTFRQELPLRLFNEPQSITAGVSLRYSPHASTLTKWTDAAGLKHKYTSSSIGHRRFSVELYGMVGLCSDFGIYVRYNPMSVLEGAGQPEFKTLTTGVTLIF